MASLVIGRVSPHRLYIIVNQQRPQNIRRESHLMLEEIRFGDDYLLLYQLPFLCLRGQEPT